MILPLAGALFDARPRPTVPWEAAWSLHPSILVGTALLGALYFWGIGPARRRYGLGPPARRSEIVAFSAGIVVMLVSLNGPIHDLSDYYLFLIHMAQHLLLTLLLPPLLIYGTPPWLLRPLVRNSTVRAIARGLTHPVTAGLLFSFVVAAWHTVPAYDLMMRNHEVHISTHLMFMVVAVLMWWPAMSRMPELPPLPLGARMLYLFVVSLPMQAVAAIITMADTPFYTWYVSAPRTWGLSPLEDQKLGGLLMWVPGNLWMFGAIAVLFFRWAREEREETAREQAARARA